MNFFYESINNKLITATIKKAYIFGFLYNLLYQAIFWNVNMNLDSSPAVFDVHYVSAKRISQICSHMKTSVESKILNLRDIPRLKTS